jgi:MFS family permease
LVIIGHGYVLVVLKCYNISYPMQKFLLALKIRSFLFLWLAELFSQIAMNMMNFILILLAFSLTKSNTAVSGIVLSFTVPAIIFGVVAGVYVDRWNKKHVLVWTNILRFLLIFTLALIYNNLIIVYVISFVSAIITQFFIPAETPMIPLLVPKERLFAANALFSMAWFGSVFIAYAISGSFLLLFGTTTALIILSLIFLIASMFAVLIRVPKEISIKGTKKSTSMWQEIKNTLKIVIKNKDVPHAFSLLILVQVLTLIISVIGPGYAQDILHININEFPLMFITPAVIGMAVGAYIVTNYFQRFSRHKSATLGLFMGALVLLLMPHAVKLSSFIGLSPIHFVVAIAFLLGFANSFMFVPSNTLVQENTSDEFRGKIYGGLNSVASLISLIPVILVGSLADIFGVGSVLTVIGIMIALIGIFRLTL